MSRRSSLNVLIAAVILAASSAMAAPRNPYKARAQAPLATTDWTGFYAGANGGLVRGGAMEQTPSGQFLNPLSYPPGGPPQLPSAMGDQSSYGGGAQAGYLRQTGALVWGYEADYFTGASTNAQTSKLLTTPLSGSFSTDFGYKIASMITLRARAGIAFDHFLLYGTGGLALASIKSAPMSSFTVGANIYDGSHTATRTGWVAGGGLEYAINEHWSIRQEYLYADLGSETFSYGDSTNNPLSGGFSFTANVHHRIQLYRFGVNFKF